MRKRFFVFAVLFSLLSLNAPNTHAGQEAHGGDIAVSIFMSTTYSLKGRIARLSPRSLPGPKFAADFNQAVKNTTVYSQDHVWLNGVELDAVNFPDVEKPRIVLSRSRWLDPKLDLEMRSRLVLHEYLSIMGYGDYQYEVSAPLMGEIFSQTK